MSLAIKVGDTAAGPRVKLIDRDAAAANLTGATVVMQVSGRADTSYAATVSDAAGGIVVVPRGDLSVTRGSITSYNVEFQVTYADTTIQTFPESGYVRLDVYADLDGS